MAGILPLIIIIYLICHSPAIMMLITGLTRLKLRPENAKKLLIAAYAAQLTFGLKDFYFLKLKNRALTARFFFDYFDPKIILSRANFPGPIAKNKIEIPKYTRASS